MSAVPESVPCAAPARRSRRGRVERTESSTVWSQIEQKLAERIASGSLRPGAQLPPEHALAEDFGVNRHTVRQAIAGLSARGLVRVAHGRGTFVSEVAVDFVLGKRTRFSENLAAVGLKGRHRLLDTGTVRATSRIAAKLGVDSGASVLRLLTLGAARGCAISRGERFFPAARFAGLATVFERTGSITRALQEFGVADYTRRESLITARMPEADVARQLGQAANRPALYVESVNVDALRRPVEFGCTWFAGDLVQLVVEPGR